VGLSPAYVRTAIHDMISDRVGAVEVPVNSVARLDPLQPGNILHSRTPTAAPLTDVPVSQPKN
jgi:hypothetical protein